MVTDLRTPRQVYLALGRFYKRKDMFQVSCSIVLKFWRPVAVIYFLHTHGKLGTTLMCSFFFFNLENQKVQHS